MRDLYRNTRYQAFLEIQTLTNGKVDLAYEIWDLLKNDLSHPDNHERAIAAQLLCNLAKNYPEGRLLSDFPALMEVTKDNRFVTLELIETEEDLKYRKKYSSVWRK